MLKRFLPHFSSRFLKYTHMRQAFRSEDDSMSDIMQRSILGHILPEAMVCYLENYSEEKFAKIFLGMTLSWIHNVA